MPSKHRSDMLAREEKFDSTHSQRAFNAAKKYIKTSTYGITPAVRPRENFACVTLVFIEDWRDGRLTAEEVCQTLLAAAVSRGIIKPAGDKK